MNFTLRTLVSSMLLGLSASALAAEAEINTVVVTSNPLSKDEHLQVLTPTKVLTGNELRAKLASNLGDTLSSELGLSASSFGAGASRPIIRGLDGPRVKVLQNGMTVADVSSVSNDHAVATEAASAQQIEILRGPASLLYGSGAIGGLVNVIDNRIPTQRNQEALSEVGLRYGSANQEKSLDLSLERNYQDWGLHLDANSRKAQNYRLPGNTGLDLAGNRMPSSFAEEQHAGLGGAWLQSWGHIGAALHTMNEKYGIPTAEQAFIDMRQHRLDLESHWHAADKDSHQFNFKLSGTDYQHTENTTAGNPVTQFKNRYWESRLEYLHPVWDGWRGTVGIQTESQKFSALSVATGRADSVPVSRSDSLAWFAVEQKEWQNWLFSTGLRLEKVERKPEGDFRQRDFSLRSFSAGAIYSLGNGYSVGVSAALAERAPTIEELYSSGPHEASASFDIGDANLKKERSKNLELSLQKSTGLWRWRINAYLNQIDDYVYGRFDGVRVDESGEVSDDAEFQRRYWGQGKARLHGAEAELSYNLSGQGWSWRAFADGARGRLLDQGNLPLQPADRLGFELNYKDGPLQTGASLIRAQKQERLASFEHYQTPAYTRLDMNLSYSQNLANAQITWFAQIKNALNQDIRIATSLLKETVPQMARSVQAGVKLQF